MSEISRTVQQTEIIINAWHYKKEDIQNYCKSLGKKLIDLNCNEAELMISDLCLRKLPKH